MYVNNENSRLSQSLGAFSYRSQSSPRSSVSFESSYDLFLSSLIESSRLTLTELSHPFFLPSNKQNNASTIDTRSGVSSEYDDSTSSESLSPPEVTRSDTPSHSPRFQTAVTSSSDSQPTSALADKNRLSINCHTDYASTKRLAVVLLNFTSLPLTRISLDCFTPCPDISYMEIQTKPLIEFEHHHLLFLRFRSKYWVGIVSTTASDRNTRRLDILNIVRHRKSKVSYILNTSTSSPALLTLESTPVDNHRPMRHESWSCPSPVNSSARYRECLAVMDVASGEIIGLAPCQPMHENRVSPNQESLLCPFSVPLLNTHGNLPQQFDIQEAVDGWRRVCQLRRPSYSFDSRDT